MKNLIILSNGENVSPEEIENKLALNPLVGEVIVTGEDNGLTARIYPEQAVVEAKALDAETIQTQLQAFLDEYNRNQPTYRRITGLVIQCFRFHNGLLWIDAGCQAIVLTCHDHFTHQWIQSQLIQIGRAHV